MADGAQEDGVELAQLGDGPLGQRFAGAQIALAAEIEGRQLVRDPFERATAASTLSAFGGDFRPGAVAGNDGDFHSFGRGHGIHGREKRVGESDNFISPRRIAVESGDSGAETGWLPGGCGNSRARSLPAECVGAEGGLSYRTLFARHEVFEPAEEFRPAAEIDGCAGATSDEFCNSLLRIWRNAPVGAGGSRRSK